eukprot:6297130-Prymnesium_polylepis.1
MSRDGRSATFASDGTYSNHTAARVTAAHAWYTSYMHEPRAVRQARVAICEGCERGRVVDSMYHVAPPEEPRRRKVRDQRAHYLRLRSAERARNESCAQLVGHVGGAVNE